MNFKRISYFLILFTLDNLISKLLVDTKEVLSIFFFFLWFVLFLLTLFFTFTPVCIPTDYFLFLTPGPPHVLHKNNLSFCLFILFCDPQSLTRASV